MQFLPSTRSIKEQEQGLFGTKSGEERHVLLVEESG